MRLNLDFILPTVIFHSFVISYPIQGSYLRSRQIVNCTDLAAPFEESCWEILDLSTWLSNFNQTTPICQGAGPGQDGSACCGPTEAWSTCFLRFAHGYPGEDCTVLNTGFCAYDATLTANVVDPAPEVAYVMKTIYAINNFFTTWYTSLQYATSNAQLTLQPIINTLDPSTPQNYDLTYILAALTADLAMIPGVGEGVLGIDATTAAVGTALLAGLQNAPGVARVLWPSGTLNTQNLQIADLDSYVSQLNANLALQLSAGLQLVMTDIPPFVGFAQSGAFSGATAPSLAQETNGLDVALKTYVLTIAMAGNRYQGASYGSTTAEAFEAGSDHCDFSIAGCTCTLNANGFCKSSSVFGGTQGGQGWYFDSNAQNLYSLIGDSPPISEDTLMQDIIDNGWSTLPLVFDGGSKCTAAGGSLDPFLLNSDGTIDLSCVSQLSLIDY